MSHDPASSPLPSLPSTTRRRRPSPELLRSDGFAGLLLLGATVVALAAANSPLAPAYRAVRDAELGPASLHLDLSVGSWAADGLLAIFFFGVGLELKHELVAGRLRSLRTALVPVAAAVGGVAVPAAVFVAINLGTPADLRGWAIPTATDVAFAIAVFAVFARSLPPALRVFLLTLAIVDDLIAILVIALVYTDHLAPLWLLLALLPLVAFGVLMRRARPPVVLLLVLAGATWALVHASGVHATIAGVLLAFTVPARGDGDSPAPTSRLAHRVAPVSALVAVPVFALFAAGIDVGGLDGLRASVTDPIALGVVAGLVLGKPVGIVLTVLAITRPRAMRDEVPGPWSQLVGVGLLAGIGFTVALLVAGLSYPSGSDADAHARVGVLLGSLVAAALGAAVLALTTRAAASRRTPPASDRE